MESIPTVRCKFEVISIIQKDDDDSLNVLLFPVTSGSEENEEFFILTPTGSLQFEATTDAAKHFAAGQEYYIDIIPALADGVTSQGDVTETSEDLVDMDPSDNVSPADQE